MVWVLYGFEVFITNKEARCYGDNKRFKCLTMLFGILRFNIACKSLRLWGVHLNKYYCRSVLQAVNIFIFEQVFVKLLCASVIVYISYLVTIIEYPAE